MRSILCFGAALLFAFAGMTLGAILFGWFGLILFLNKVFPVLPIRWAHAVTFELIALFAIHITLLFPDKRGNLKGDGRPILLVHGYLHHAKVWYFQKKWLEALGLGPIYTIHFKFPFQSIRTYAEQVKVKAEEIARETGRDDLILIGHSMGGLVASWYALKLAKRGQVTHLITLGSPLHGTPVARIAIGPNGREIEPNSPLTQELLASIEENREIQFYHIGTETDFLVIPGKSSIIEQNRHDLFRDIGHTALLFSKSIPRLIKEFVSVD